MCYKKKIDRAFFNTNKSILSIYRLLCLVFLASSATAQTVSQQATAASGGSFQGTQGSLDWTIGESITTSLMNTNNALTQGFQQPSIKITQSVTDEIGVHGIAVYPNPTADAVYVDIAKTGGESASYSLYDSQGKLIESHSINGSQNAISLACFSAGTYILQVKNSDQKSSFIILKTN